ncbi:MAG: hypothetical protein ACRCTE_11645 [Cellulosilyticaceae bacterium]
MQSIKYLSQMVLHYLPPGAKLLQIKQYYDSPSLLEGDINQDGNAEIILIYKSEGSNYIAILENYGRYLERIWNSKISVVEVSVFELVTLTKTSEKYILLGGKAKGEQQSRMYLLGWKNGQLGYMLKEGVAFDKLYCEDLEPKDGIDEIIIWTHSFEEAYDVNIYIYEDHQLVETNAYERVYFKTMRQYYTHLCKSYPKEQVYQDYLQEAKRKCLEEDVVVPITLNTEEEQWESEAIEPLMTIIGYIGERDEEMITLLGKRSCENDRTRIESFKLSYTTGGQSKLRVVTPFEGDINDYKLFLGDFTRNGREDIFLQVHDTKGHLRGWIYTCQEGVLKEILSLGDLRPTSYTVTRKEHGRVEILQGNEEKLILEATVVSGSEQGDILKIGNIIKAYAVDEEHLEQYTVQCAYPILYSESQIAIGYLVRCFGYKEHGFKELKAYVSYRL